GISYAVETRTPVLKVDSLESINTIPVVSPDHKTPQLLANMARIDRGVTPEVVTHVNIQSTYDVYANIAGRDLGSVAREIAPILDEYRAKLSPGDNLVMRGQVESMQSAFLRL